MATKFRIPTFRFLALFCSLAAGDAGAGVRDGIATVPPMGFNSYYMRGPFIDESLIRGMVDYLHTNRLDQLGYRYVVIDEGWTRLYGDPNGRDAAGKIVPDPTRFPDMRALVNYIHSKGLLAGIYTEDGAWTAGGHIGSGGHFGRDAASYSQWGFDFVKFDVYQADYLDSLRRFAAALDATGRPIFLYTGINGFFHAGPDPAVVQTANAYRFIGDVICSYERFTNVLFYGCSIPDAVTPNHWVDFDTLLWNAGRKPSLPALRTSLGMLSMLSAPLMVPAFLDQSVWPTFYQVLTNAEVIAVNQDARGIPARCINTNGSITLWVKPIGPEGQNVKAVALMNLDTVAPRTATVEWSQIGLSRGPAKVRDLWSRSSFNATNHCRVNIGPGDLAIFSISPFPAPQLRTQRGPKGLLLSWVDPSSAYRLETSPRLQAPTWFPLPQPIQSLNGSNWVMLQIPNGFRFFRLTQ
jgi:alpha-galactosidase